MNIHPEINPTDRLANIVAEQQMLGALLINDTIIDRLPPYLTADLFFDPVHADLFTAIMDRHKAGLMVNPVTLRIWADDHEGAIQLGGARYLVRLAGHAVSTFAFDHYASILRELHAKRGIMAAAMKAVEDLQRDDETAQGVAGRLEAALMGDTAGSADGPISMMKAVTQAMERIGRAQSGEPDPRVKTGIAELDRIVPGLSPGDFVLIGGRPSMGKSAVAIELALNAARSGKGVCFASLEMPSESLALRAISQATTRPMVPYSDMLNGGMPEPEYRSVIAAVQNVAELPIQFLPASYRDIGALYAGAKRAKAMLGETVGLKLLIVDYLQLLRAPGRGRFDQITEISIALKSLAMQLEIPVVALSQLSRNLEIRDDKRPQLSDLRESGQLEQDADTIIFTYRDEYYLERERPQDHDFDKIEAWQAAMSEAKNKLELIVGKQRQGPIGTAHCMFNPATNTIWGR